ASSELRLYPERHVAGDRVLDGPLEQLGRAPPEEQVLCGDFLGDTIGRHPRARRVPVRPRLDQLLHDEPAVAVARKAALAAALGLKRMPAVAGPGPDLRIAVEQVVVM